MEERAHLFGPAEFFGGSGEDTAGSAPGESGVSALSVEELGQLEATVLTAEGQALHGDLPPLEVVFAGSINHHQAIDSPALASWASSAAYLTTIDQDFSRPEGMILSLARGPGRAAPLRLTRCRAL